MNVVLYNIAMCQRALDRREDSIATFERYLAEGGERVPPERRQEVERHLAEMHAWLEANLAPPETTPPPAPVEPPLETEPIEPANLPSEAEPTEPIEPDETSEPAVEPLPEDGGDPEPASRRPLYRRWGFWVALIGGAAAVGLGVGLGVGLSGDDDPPPYDYLVSLP